MFLSNYIDMMKKLHLYYGLDQSPKGFSIFEQVFSEMDFLGWYSTGEAPTEDDISFHKQICEVNESPLFLQLNPISKKPSDLPICVFESVIDIVGGETRMLFVKLGYTLATEEVC